MRNKGSKKHHVVPRWLLKKFHCYPQGKEDEVWFLRKTFNSKDHQEKCWKGFKLCHVSSIFYVKYLHNFKEYNFEDSFSELENISEVLDKNLNILTISEKYKISGLMYSLLLREQLLEMKLQNKTDTTKKVILPFQTFNIKNQEDIASIDSNQYLQNLMSTVAFSTNDINLTTIQPIIQRINFQFNLVNQYDWKLLYIDKLNTKFLIGDRPVLMISDTGSINDINLWNLIMEYEASKTLERISLYGLGITDFLHKKYLDNFNKIILPITPNYALFLIKEFSLGALLAYQQHSC